MEAADEDGKQRRDPRGRDGEKGEGAFFSEALGFGAVMGEQSDGAGEKGKGGGGAEGGEKVQGDGNEALRQPMERKGDEPKERGGEIGLPGQPAGNPGDMAEAVDRNPIVERAEVEEQGARCDEPGEGHRNEAFLRADILRHCHSAGQS